MGAPAEFKVPTQEISREAFFNLKDTKPTTYDRVLKSIGSVTKKIVPFPFPGSSGMRLAYFVDSPAKSFTKHAIIGSVVGLAFGAVWRYWHIKVYNVRNEDFNKQLAIANREEAEKLRLRLVEESKARKAAAAE